MDLHRVFNFHGFTTKIDQLLFSFKKHDTDMDTNDRIKCETHSCDH